MWAEHTEEMLHYGLKCTFNLKDITSVIQSLKPSAVSFQEQQIKTHLVVSTWVKWRLRKNNEDNEDLKEAELSVTRKISLYSKEPNGARGVLLLIITQHGTAHHIQLFSCTVTSKLHAIRNETVWILLTHSSSDWMNDATDPNNPLKDPATRERFNYLLLAHQAIMTAVWNRNSLSG